MHALEHGHRWSEAFTAVGVVLRPDEIRASVEQFLDDALSRC
jgi:hypothetical protein